MNRSVTPAETGYTARYYDPLIGRFTQPDTIVPDSQNPQDLNRYTYVRNNPARFSDPTGNGPCLGGYVGVGLSHVWDLDG